MSHSSDYSSYVNHYVLCISKAVKRATEPHASCLRSENETSSETFVSKKLLGHLGEQMLAELALAGKSQ